jgi:hypothetical protein
MIVIEDLCLYEEVLNTLSENQIEPDLKSWGNDWGIVAVSDLPDNLSQQFSDKGATIQHDKKFDLE